MPTLTRLLSCSLVITIVGALTLCGPAVLTAFAASVTPVHLDKTAVNLCPSGTVQFRLEEQQLTDGVKTDGDIEIQLDMYAAPDGDPLSAFDFTVLSGHTITRVGTMDGVDGGYIYDYSGVGGTQGDTFLTSPGPADGGTYKDISFIDFCYELAALPTAAPASISGRVTQPNGRGIGGAVITLENHSTGQVAIATTNSFGYYKFHDMEVTHFYTLSASSKRNRFANSSISFSLDSDMFDMNFVSSR